MNKFIVIFITAASVEESEKISTMLVKEKLAACVNMIPQIQSCFLWKKKACIEEEILLIVKSKLDLLDTIIDRVKDIHSYEVPEIIALPIIGGSDDYLEWVQESVC